MAAAETTNADRQAKTTTAKFVNDEHGRILFYPSGLSRTGYVVDSAMREKALREAAERYGERARQAGSILVVPVLAVFYWLVRLHPLLAFGLIAAVLPATRFVEELVSGIVFGSLVENLERVAPQKKARWIALIVTLAAVSATAWLILQLYDLRLATLPRNGAIDTFYDDISWRLISAIAGALAVLLLLRQPTSRLTEPRRFVVLLMFGLIGAGGLAWTISAFADPKPVVTVMRGTLSCRWQVAWLEVADISLKNARFRGAWVEVSPQSGSSTDLWARRAGLQ
jgi:hypothetical protein